MQEATAIILLQHRKHPACDQENNRTGWYSNAQLHERAERNRHNAKDDDRHGKSCGSKPEQNRPINSNWITDQHAAPDSQCGKRLRDAICPGCAECSVTWNQREIKEHVPGLCVITDVCMCEYTDHGHCGAVVGHEVDNDASLELLVREALSHARAGADIVAPSDMMDGRVGAIRSALDKNGFAHVAIMAYSAKFASAFYGPFREAAESAPQFGDRRSYQMDPPNGDEAMREVALDLEEGADIVMVKPALPYLDLIYRVKQGFNVPVAAYNVSGEYSMIRAAGLNGWLDEERTIMEVLTSIRRAGADLILTYFATEVAKKLQR